MNAVPTTAAVKALINQELEDLFAKRITEAAELSPHYEALWRTIKKVSKSGKRLRPYLTILAYQAWGGNADSIQKVALAQELVHIALLIHDDIIDRDLQRHGEPNVAGHFLETYAEFLPDTKDRRHYADSAALLAGDLLISEAHYQLAGAAREEIHAAFFSVIGGQLLDTEAAFRDEPADPLTIAHHKTASYSFVGPLVAGAGLAGASKAEIKLLNAFAEDLGIGFQLRDDLIGTFGQEKTTGKSADGDIRQAKHTLLIEAFYKRADVKTKETFERYFGKHDASDADIQTARSILEQTGARQDVEAHIDVLSEKALETLEELSLSDEYKQALSEMVRFCLYRDH